MLHLYLQGRLQVAADLPEQLQEFLICVLPYRSLSTDNKKAGECMHRCHKKILLRDGCCSGHGRRVDLCCKACCIGIGSECPTLPSNYVRYNDARSHQFLFRIM